MKQLTKLEHELHLNRLRKYNNFLEIWNDWYYQEYFVKKYVNDIPKLAYEVFGTTFTYQQLDIWNEFIKSGGWKGGRLAVSSGHGTGKTRFIGNIVAGFFLLFRKSIIRIQAPKQEQVTKFSWKEITNCFENMTIKRKIGENTFIEPKWGFIRKHIQINKTLMYAKGFNEKWYIEPATAPKGDPTNLSGQHNKYYLLIFDEASGIEDTHIEASLGGLSEAYNSCIMFSQHTRLQGKFHDFVTAKNVTKGGVWHTLRLSSRYSPMVSKKQLENWFSTYTEDEMRVRVDGLPPRHQDGTLISDIQAYSIYENDNKIFRDETIFKSLVFSYDLAYTGYRDSSIVSVYEVATIKNNITQKIKSYYKKVDIHLFQGFNGKLPMEFIEEVFKIILSTIDNYSNNGRYFNRTFVIGDATAGGHEPFKKLEEMFLELNRYNIEFKPLMWGSEKLYFEDKKRFINGRAKAYVNLKEALEEKRFKSVTDKYKDRTLNELKNIFYSFDSKFRYKILNKEEMKKKGVNSPDIADTDAQIMLLKFDEVDFEIENKNHNQVIEEVEAFEDENLIELESDFNEDIEVTEDVNIDKDIGVLLPNTLNNFNLDDEF